MDFKQLQAEKAMKQYEQHCQKIMKATILDIHENADQKSKRIERLKKDYIAFFEYYFPHYTRSKTRKYIPCAKFHRELANAIIGDRKSKTLAEIYRSGAKSSHIAMGIPIFMMINDEMRFMLLIGKNERKAKKLISAIQSELEYNQRFINDYGRLVKVGDWSNGDFITTTGVRFAALGFGQDPRGFKEGSERPDYIVPDDIDGKAHLNNNELMTEAVDYLQEDVMGCFDSSDDAVERFAYANNNFHKNSITNRLKKEFEAAIKADKEAGIKTQYKVITVNAVKDLVTFEPTWPEKTSAEYWRAKYVKRKRSFLREFMNTHVSEGKIFKPEYFQWKKMIPLHEYDALVFYGDLSYKVTGDFKSGILMGKKAREFHVIHVFLRQSSRKRMAEWLYDLYEEKKLNRYNVKYKIEGLFAMDEFVNDFDTEGDTRGYLIPVIADKKSKDNKFERIDSDEGYFERRWVWFNEEEKTSSDQMELIEQYLAFEKGSGAHDDGPDAANGAFAECNQVAFVEKFEPQITARVGSGRNRY